MADTNTVTFVPNYAFTLSMLKVPERFVRTVRDVEANGTAYTVSYAEGGPVDLNLISLDAYNALIAGLDPSESLLPMINTVSIPVTAVGVRFEEFYRVVTGLTEFNGSYLGINSSFVSTGIQKKIIAEGRVDYNQAEAHISVGENVTTDYPISDTTSVSAYKAGGDLTPQTIATPNLGIVPLHDGVSPLANGVTVQIAYTTIRHCIISILDQNKAPMAILLSPELMTYLTANAA
jgi:hypothetical protein